MSDRKRHKTKRQGIYYREGADGRRHYSVHYRDSAGKSRSKTIEGGMREAEAALDSLRDRMRKGERVLPSKVTFGEYAETWLDAQTQLRPRTTEAYRWALDRHLLPRFEHRKLSTLTENDATDLIAAMRAKGYAGSTIRSALLPLSRVLAHAARRGLVPTNPIDRLERGERPRTSRGEMRCLDREGIAALLDAADDPGVRTLLALSVSAGLRQGEALGLRWADLDLSANVLRVRWQLGRDGTRVEPKTPQARREVDLAPSLVAMLREHRLRSLHSGQGDPVFSSADGSPFHYLRVGRALRTIADRAGLNGDGRPKLRWHDLRHTAASLLVAEGLNVVYVSRQLGHANPSITLTVYAHLFARSEHAERARSAMDAALGNKWATPDGKQGENEPPAEPGKVAQLRGIGADGN
jgi:integrase